MERFEMNQHDQQSSKPNFNSDCCLKICFVAAFVAIVAIAVSAFVAVKLEKSYNRHSSHIIHLGHKVLDTINKLPSIINSTNPSKIKYDKDIIASGGSDFNFKKIYEITKEVVDRVNANASMIKQSHNYHYDDDENDNDKEDHVLRNDIIKKNNDESVNKNPINSNQDSIVFHMQN